jgi:hypothetical protein
MRRWLAIVVLSLTTAGAVAAPPAHVAADVPEARLAGAGDYTWFGMRIYQAQLWVGPLGYQGAASATGGFAALFHPPALSPAATVAWLLAALLLVYAAYGLAGIA